MLYLALCNHFRHTAQEESDIEEQQAMDRTQAANMYRQRRHVSVEDTISLSGDANESPAAERRHEFAQQVIFTLLLAKYLHTSYMVDYMSNFTPGLG